MKKLLFTSTFLIVPASVYAQGCQAPSPAAAAGYTVQSFGGAPTIGRNWLLSSPSGTGTTQNADGSVTIANPSNNHWNGQLQTWANGQGAAFGGGGYFQATLSWSGSYSGSGGWPSFWADGQDAMAGPHDAWPEPDIMEAWGNNNWSGTLHSWSGGGASNIQTSSGGIVTPGFDPAQRNTYGMLWVPASPASQGKIQWFLNGKQVGQTVTWDQGQGPHASLDQKHLALFLGTGSNPMTVYDVQVWQASAANDIGVSGASTASGCAPPAAINMPEPSAPQANPIAAEIVPGQGSIMDSKGNNWTISPSGSIMEGNQYTPGGGATAAVEVANGQIWGKDNGSGPICPGCWFTLSTDGQTWEPKPGQEPPSEIASLPVPGEPPPIPPAPQCPADGPGTGAFHVAGGQIIGPNGKPWIARGLNLYDDQLDQAGAMTGSFPGLNFARVNIHSYQDPSAYQAFVTEMTSAGRVVEFEDHPDGGGGQDAGPPKGMAAELSWYAAMAKAYAGNPYVWFGTFNEPMATPGLSAWQRSTYDAIRGAGNKNPILLEISGYPGNWTNSLDPSVYATMTNTIWDPHFYGWIPRYSTDQTTVDQALADELVGIQQIKSADGTMPVLVGEYGDSTDGTNVDTNGIQVVTSVINGVTQKNVPGAIAWAYDPGGNADHVTNGGQVTHPYGAMMRLFIGNDVVQPTQCQVTAQAHQLINTLTTQLAATSPGAPDAATPPETRPQTPAVDTSIASDIAQADALVAQAQAILKGIPTQ